MDNILATGNENDRVMAEEKPTVERNRQLTLNNLLLFKDNLKMEFADNRSTMDDKRKKSGVVG